MSVLIKGMEMPTSCRDCRFCNGQADTDYGVCAWCDVDGNARDAYTMQDCPLVPVICSPFKTKPATNYDRLVSKSPEELAEWLAEVLFHCSNTICDERCPMYKCCCDQPSDNIEDWLKEEATE